MLINQIYTKYLESSVPSESDVTGYQRLPSMTMPNWSAMVKTLQTVKDGVLVINPCGQIEFMNVAAERLTGWQFSPKESLEMSAIFGHTHSVFWDESQEPLNPRQTSLTLWNGQELVLEYSTIPIHNQQNEQTHTISVFRELSRMQTTAEILPCKDETNPLTGLMNRYCFGEYLEKTLVSMANAGIEHTLCQLDLDRFKIINDTCGHAVGDEFLRQVSTILQRRVRKSDVLAYLEGDKFGLILYHCNLEQAYQVLESLREDINNFRFVWKDEIFRLSLSIGAVLLDANHNASQALSAASAACQTAKNNGRNRIHFFGANDLDIKTQQGETQWVLKILKALEENQFQLYHQTIIPLRSPNLQQLGCKYNCEILIRLLDESKQVIPPGTFLPAAEKYGLMPMIDRWVIRNLFQYLSELIQKTKNSDAISLPEDGSPATPGSNYFYTVNLSGASLNDDQFLDYIQEQFKLFSIPPAMICFEITETIAIASFSKTVQFIMHLKAMGCHFALDDFGSGMSSFGYLQQLPVDYLKIDGMFIKEILTNPTAHEIVEAINRIAHVMGIQTVAEWVENEQMLSKVERLGIDYAQGFGIAKPQPLV
jgi:diguanylate cyclase (GGDEF)-like protein